MRNWRRGRRVSLLMTGAWLLLGPAGGCSSQSDAPRVEVPASPKESAIPARNEAAGEDLHTRWRRLRSEYIAIVTPLLYEEPVDDSADLRMASMEAEAEFKQAELVVEVAKIDLKKFEEGTKKQDLAIRQAAIEGARSEVKAATDRLRQAEEVREQMRKASSTAATTPGATDLGVRLLVDEICQSARHQLAVAKGTLEREEIRLKVLNKYEHPQKEMELKANIEKAIFDAKRKEARLDLAKSKEQRRSRPVTAVVSPPRVMEEEAALRKALADTPRWTADTSPLDGDPEAFQAFLDKLDAKLAEIRPLNEALQEARAEEDFRRLTDEVRQDSGRGWWNKLWNPGSRPAGRTKDAQADSQP